MAFDHAENVAYLLKNIYNGRQRLMPNSRISVFYAVLNVVAQPLRKLYALDETSAHLAVRRRSSTRKPAIPAEDNEPATLIWT